jgi:hypothetical protein
MSEPSAFGFGQFVPGFDFLQNLSKTASQAQPAAAGMPGMASWVAPTLSIEDIDKRIQELKSVLFWLEQNTTALKATIQAMEVQKMTLTTLQGMNVNMADLAKAFTAKPPEAEPAAASPAPASHAANKSSLFTPKPEPEPMPTPEPSAQAKAAPNEATHPATPESTPEAAKPAVDPMQWWGALTQQFQSIAAAAMKDVAGEAMKAGMVAKTAKTSKPAKAAKAPASRKAVAKKSAASGRVKAPTKKMAAKSQGARGVPAKASVRQTTSR